MKILAFGDTHGDFKSLRKIAQKAKKVDIVVCVGDITFFGEDMEILVHELSTLKKPVLMIPGNHELEKELRVMCNLFDNLYYINKKYYREGNYLFLGYGGGGFSYVDKEFEKLIPKFKKLIKKDDKVILVTHALPYNTKLDFIYKEHHGNKSIRKFIDKQKPILNICGHFHETEGKKQVINKKTLTINPGPEGVILEV